MGFSRQEYWRGLPFPSPGDLSDPGIKPGSPALQADSLPTELWGKPLINPKDRGHLWAIVRGVAELDTTKWLTVSLSSYMRGETEAPNLFMEPRLLWDCRLACSSCRLEHPSVWSIECSSAPVCWDRLAWSGLSPSGASRYEDLLLPRACLCRETPTTTLEHKLFLFSCFDINPRNIANVRLQKLQRRGFGGNFQILERSRSESSF